MEYRTNEFQRDARDREGREASNYPRRGNSLEEIPMVYRYSIRINSSDSSRRGAFDSGATKAGDDNGKTAIDFSPPRRGVG